jgi:lipopolysaccharide export LptBFGC system permease protein LptF
MGKRTAGGILVTIGTCFLMISIFFGSNPSPTAYGFGVAIVTYFVPLALIIVGTILLSTKK